MERRGNASIPGIPTATLGALRELLVCADLMKRGYDVYRAQSPACPCDLVAIRGKETLRIEVKSGQLRNDGTCFPVTVTVRQRESFDVLAVVTGDDRVHYLPELPHDPGE